MGWPLDWTLGDLPESTRRLVKDALISKAIQPSLNEKLNGWVKVETKNVTWAMMTQADAEIIAGGVLLKQNGKILKVMIRQPEGGRLKWFPRTHLHWTTT